MLASCALGSTLLCPVQLADVTPVASVAPPEQLCSRPVPGLPGVIQRHPRAHKPSPNGCESPKNTVLTVAKVSVLLSPLPREIQVKKKTLLKNYIINSNELRSLKERE